MPEYYTLVEMEQYQKPTMPPVTDKRPVQWDCTVFGVTPDQGERT